MMRREKSWSHSSGGAGTKNLIRASLEQEACMAVNNRLVTMPVKAQ
jgi:hypothetical protein